MATAKKKSTWGGARAGAGRKAGPNPKVGHRPRVEHDARHPVLVTLRRAEGVPSLRGGALLRLVRDAIRDTSDAGVEGFRIVLFAVAATHLSLVIEADDRAGQRHPQREHSNCTSRQHHAEA